MTACVTPALPFADYLAMPAVSAHGLMSLARSPAHYRHQLTAPRAPSPAQQLGTLVHLLTLEPERASEYAVAPECDRRTTAGKQRWAEFVAQSEGREVVTMDIMEQALAMCDAVHRHTTARQLLASGAAEQSLTWSEPLADGNPIPCKARIDWHTPDYRAVVDLKTARSAAWAEFRRDATKYRYGLQAAHYLSGAAHCDLDAASFVFIVVESDPPHGVALFQFDDDSLAAAHETRAGLLRLWRDCQTANAWPSYPDTIQTIDIPAWSLS